MSAERPRTRVRPLRPAALLLAVIAYLPALTAAPGRMPADSKLYLYLDPGRFIVDAAGSFDPRQFAGWVPHQHIAYLWPAGPWYWVFETLGVPDWIAHRLWIGTIMLAAGLGVRWCVRLLGLSAGAALAAAVVYQTSLYVLPYVSRTSVMLLPWAGLGWIVAFTIRASRRHGWGDPAAIALIVLTVGAVNATALAMIIPAPVLWLLHSAWQRLATWRQTLVVAAKVGVLSLGVSLWWIAMLMIQGTYGTDVLPYSESVADVSLTSTSAEVWRGLGYWLFYLRDPFAATTTESLRYLVSSLAIFVSFLIPIVCVAGLVWTRWQHRRFAALLVATGVVLAVGVHPSEDRSPLMWLLTGGDDGGLALALRSSTRAVPLLMLGLSIAAAALIDSFRTVALPRFGLPRPVRADHAIAGLVALLALANLPGLWTGAFVDPALDRDESPPAAWTDAATVLDRSGDAGRVLQLPGAEFGAYRWGYTVDQPLPGLTEKPLITRDLLPLGSPAAMDLLYALDDQIQQGVLQPDALAPVARLLGVDTIWLTNDHEFERFRTARPEAVRDLVIDADGMASPRRLGDPFLNRPEVPHTDERALGDPRVGRPMVPVELVELWDPPTVVRASEHSVVVSGSGDGLVDAAAAGLLDGKSTVRYSASLDGDPDQLVDALDAATALVVTDSNRDRARHWRSSQDTTGITEYTDPRLGPLEPVPGDERLPVFESPGVDAATVAIQRGPVTAAATSYGEPFAYLPEHRPFMAIDGNLATAWLVAEHADPVGEMLRLHLHEGVQQVIVQQPLVTGARRITEVTIVGTDADGAPTGDPIRVALDDRSVVAPGQAIGVDPAARTLDIRIAAIGGGVPGTAGVAAAVGFVEVTTGLEPTTEIIRPPHDALAIAGTDTPLALSFNRLRSDPMNRWRDDPEPMLVREFELSDERTFDVAATVRVDARATDDVLAGLLGWPARASTRLTGSIRNAGIATLDGDPGTAWITGFGEALGARLIIADVAAPVSEITIRQPVSGFSTVTAITVGVDAERRSIELTPDALGVTNAVVDPPLPPGTVTIELTGVEPATTVDRRFGDVVELPAAISEISLAGRPELPRLGADTHRFECAEIAEIDGSAITASITIEGDGWLDGAPLAVAPCAPTTTLGPGPHLATSVGPAQPLTLDALVLDDRVAGVVADLQHDAVATVVDSGRFERQIVVDGCTGGCWLVFGEGYNEAWTAEMDGQALGDPVLVDGGFNGWWLAPGPEARSVVVHWTPQRRLTLALWASLLATVVAVCLLVLDRRTPEIEHRAVPTPGLAMVMSSLSSRQAIAMAVAWTGLPALLISPSWAVWGAIAGLATLVTRQRRLPELTALACLIVVGASVVFLERRDAPFPNGAWPSTFDAVHGIGVFAVAALLTGALFQDSDGDIQQSCPKQEVEPDQG